ncbi:MAG: membrane dipeptidase [Phycisphaerales bacterium]|nr:membrane dipeptidase [Phycisphaerales bacterium]
MQWFDAHLDLAYLAECGRDMHVEPEESRGRNQPATITLPSLRAGGVRACLGTIFTEAIQNPAASDAETGSFAYAAGDARGAWVAGMRQLKLYHAWRDAGIIRLMGLRGQNAGAAPSDERGPILLGVLMECADPIESPDQLLNWVENGVIAIGMAWWHQSRYAGGNGTPGHGLTQLGKQLVPRIDELGVVHDLSHLSQKSTEQLLSMTSASVIASHSNCRALLEPDNERHLADETIREIGRRGGMIGLNLVRNFIRTGIDRKDPNDRPSIAEAIRHVEHICEVMGHRRGVGMGSDMDGGITGHDLPRGIDRPRDFEKLAEELRSRGWSDADIRGFSWGNWARFWGVS